MLDHVAQCWVLDSTPQKEPGPSKIIPLTDHMWLGIRKRPSNISFHNSVFNGIFVIKHPWRDPLVRSTAPFWSLTFFFFSFLLSLGSGFWVYFFFFSFFFFFFHWVQWSGFSFFFFFFFSSSSSFTGFSDLGSQMG